MSLIALIYCRTAPLHPIEPDCTYPPGRMHLTPPNGRASHPIGGYTKTARLGDRARRRSALPSAGVLQLRDLVVGELERRGLHVVLEVIDLRRARDRQHHGRAMQQPGERELRRRCPVPLRDRGERATRVRQAARVQREPRDEPDVLALAGLEYRLRRAVAEVVPVLDARDGRERAHLVELRHVDLGEPDEADLPLLAQLR